MDPNPFIIPTRHKGALAKGTSYPGGAEYFSAALCETPQLPVLGLHFGGPVAPGALLSGGYRRVVEVSYAQSPPSLTGDHLDHGGYRKARWELAVYPVLSVHRSAVRVFLDAEGLLLIQQWLVESWSFHGSDGRASIAIDFDCATKESRTILSNSILPTR